jgi:hypothetical protein
MVTLVEGTDMKVLRALIDDARRQGRALVICLPGRAATRDPTTIAATTATTPHSGSHGVMNEGVVLYPAQQLRTVLALACACTHQSRHFSPTVSLLDMYAPWLSRVCFHCD